MSKASKEFNKLLQEEYGYNFIAVPKAGIEPLQVGATSGSLGAIYGPRGPPRVHLYQYLIRIPREPRGLRIPLRIKLGRW